MHLPGVGAIRRYFVRSNPFRRANKIVQKTVQEQLFSIVRFKDATRQGRAREPASPQLGVREPRELLVLRSSNVVSRHHIDAVGDQCGD
jgi:hypothetical protein